ncbi:MAG: alpha/beta fold hydrolase [Mycobacterium sp.]
MAGDTATRSDVEFTSDGVVCRAWLYTPDRPGPHPIIVMAHGLGGVRDMRLDAFAERFTTTGYACLVFDYRYFGASDGQPRQLLDIKSQLTDWAAAIGYARSRGDLDPSRIVLWGTSFSGGHVIATAARDHGIAAAIAQCPFTDGIASASAMYPITSAKVTVMGIADVIAHKLGRPAIMVDLAGPPLSAALMTAPDAMPGYLALAAAGSAHRNEVAARVALQIPLHRPGLQTGDIQCPILFCVCETDSVAPAKATLQHARRAPRGEVRLYREGHFDIYRGDAFEKVVADQIAFLHHHVPVTN